MRLYAIRYAENFKYGTYDSVYRNTADARKNEEFIAKIHRERWIPLPFHDDKIMNQYRKLSANIVQVI